MKILFIGNFKSWMKLHLEHLIAGFQAAGFQTGFADYHAMENWGILPLPEAWRDEQRQRNLERIVKRYRPDVCYFVGSCKFDLLRLKSYWPGVAVFHDYDGPRRKDIDYFCQMSRDCLLLTVSRYIEDELKKRNCQSFYLPHGVDVDYYAPTGGSGKKFPAFCSYIGRATPRRVEYCTGLAPDIALYGDRWKKTALADVVSCQGNVHGRDVVSIYRDSTMMINILQEPLEEFQTILSLQCFAIPAAGGCLAAEWVQEFPESFEEGKEILTFRTAGELVQLTEKIKREPELARQIGAAARKRCLAEHTHKHRAEKFRTIIG